VSLDAWQILKVVQQVERHGGRVTLGMLADLIRGAGGGSFGVVSNNRKGKGTGKEKIGLDLDEIAGGKVALSKDVSFWFIVKVLIQGCYARTRKPCLFN
jgi:ATP-dependent DNA helicase Q1